MSERIAVAIDFSSESERALEEAVAMARPIGADIHMLHVSARFDLDQELADLAKLEADLRADVRTKLADLHERFDGRGPALSQSLLEGDVATELCSAVSDLDCSTLVMGTHGRTGLRRFFLGSIAEKTARMAPCDVLISRGSRPMQGYRRILVPTDFSAGAEVALMRATELAAPDAEIDLVHVWQYAAPVTTHYAPLASHSEALKRIAAQARGEAEEKAAALLAAHRRPGVGIDFSTVNGNPSHAIIDRAAGCDLIVMGTHGRRGFARLTLGSVTEKTIRHAPCSVLATRASASESA